MYVGISLFLIILGLILIALEIFIVPGFGYVGIPGLLMMIGGVFLLADNLAEGLVYLLITFLAAGLIIFAGVKTGRLKKLWGKISLKEKQNSHEGYLAPKIEYTDFLGKNGVALTLLRPAGTALIHGQRVDVVTEGSFIAKGSEIKVIAVEGTRIIVTQDNNQKE